MATPKKAIGLSLPIQLGNEGYFATNKDTISQIADNINKDKKNIVIGYSHHYRNINKRINIPQNAPYTKFIINGTRRT